MWPLSRELLAEGLTCEAGWGDVRILPDPVQEGQVLLRLGVPRRHRWCRLTAYQLGDFLTGTYRHIPLGLRTAAHPPRCRAGRAARRRRHHP